MLRRVSRISGSPHAIAAGVASGAAVSFLPLPGLHFGLGAVLALCVRGSLIASAIGTVIGNPWTFPFIWLGSYKLGRAIGFGEGAAVAEGSIGRHLSGVVNDILEGRFQAAALDSWPVFGPMLVGGGIMGLAVWLAFYFGLRRLITAYQHRRQTRMAEGRARWRRPAQREAGEESSA